MIYRRNLPAWERVARLLAAAAMAFCAWQLRAGPGGIVFAIAAATTALTSIFGFCPMCALAARRLPTKDKAVP
jgi:hypothetical protein